MSSNISGGNLHPPPICYNIGLILWITLHSKVNLSEGTETELFEIVDDELGRKALYDELIIEDDSHVINWQILQDASILNELRYIDCKFCFVLFCFCYFF